MSNYPVYSYQPQMGGYGQQMQTMYQQPAYQTMQPPMQQEQNLFCRMAASRDEVTAFPTDFTGKPLTFIGPQAQVVWIKTFNPNTGSSNVEEYHKAEQASEQPKYVTTADLEQVLQLLQKQGEDIAILKGQRRRMNKEETEDV